MRMGEWWVKVKMRNSILTTDKTKAIFLAHLSEECNLDGIAIDTVYSIVTSKNKRAKHIVFDALKQNEATIYDQD